MFTYLHKNKKGFTLIELMVVVAIIGILALLGLRLYTGQQDKAKEAIVKANAGTVQTLIQAELADAALADAAAALTAIGGANAANLQNPFTGDAVTATADSATPGIVKITHAGGVFTITGNDKDGAAITGYSLTAQR